MPITIAKLSTISTLDSTQFSRGLGKMRTDIGAFSAISFGAFNRIGGMIADFSRRAITALPRMVSNSLAAGDALNELATELGFSTEALANLQRVASLQGITDLSTSIGKMNTVLGEAQSGNKAAIKSFEDLGLHWEELAKQKPEDTYFAILDAMKQLPSVALRSARAVEIFGKAGRGQLKLIGMGSAGINAEMGNTRRMGLASNPQDLALMDRANDALADMRNAFKGLTDQLTIELSPAIEKIANTVRNSIVKSNTTLPPSSSDRYLDLSNMGMSIPTHFSAKAEAGMGPPLISNFRREAQIRQGQRPRGRSRPWNTSGRVFGPPSPPYMPQATRDAWEAAKREEPTKSQIRSSFFGTDDNGDAILKTLKSIEKNTDPKQQSRSGGRTPNR